MTTWLLWVAVKTQQQAKRHKETKYFDLVIKRKAVSQLMGSFINWQQEQKKDVKHAWDAKLCRQEEFSKVANGLLQMVGRSIGWPCMEHQKVVIAIGLAKFSSTHGPPALNSSLEANKACLLGYLVVGINEYYLSKRCHIYNNFVSQTSEWRALCCHTCKRFRWQDVMASYNMNIVIKGHLKDQQRPQFL
ncbi:hypothetical protein BG006_010334 [Podila minutissima]|uniref:Uncharacterized protein n=1 Tax=Podila minutissima TaxID=64525 RepID=A0A9P5STK7_9FUNG|nr:hypothetical protein BG006_010334 [Podila minutissima]